MSLNMLSRLGKKDALEATTAGARALLRRARNAAQEERWATVVEVDAKASELRAQTRSTITQFGFDGLAAAAPAGGDDADAPSAPAAFQVAGALGYAMTVEGGEVVQGRVGQGLLFERPGAWGWVEDRPALSPAEGVFVELMLYLGDLSATLRDRARERPSDAQERAAERAGERPRAPAQRVVDWRRRAADAPPLYTAVRKGRAWSLGVTADHAIEVALTGPAPDGGPEVTFIARTRPDTLRAERWFRVALAFDGKRSRVIVDGIPRVHLPLPGYDVLPATLMRDRAPLTLSDPDPEAGFYGVIDELKVAAVLASQRLEVPQDVLLVAPDDAVGFDLLGQLDTARHAEPIVIYLTDDERAWDLLAGATPGQGEGTRTRADQARERAAAGATPYARFVAGLGTLDPMRWRAVVVERTGLVR
ncbi:MAG: LamG domain-containing protein [Planctomycetes bacterium]|nr:LamG domain-containing protein [Planctomycetota bacterium]